MKIWRQIKSAARRRTLDRQLGANTVVVNVLNGLALSLASGLVFGFAPALQLLRHSQVNAMVSGQRRRFQDVFVAAEVAAALVLLVATGLLLRNLWAVGQVNPGFDPHSVESAFLSKPKNDPGFVERHEARLETQLIASAGSGSAAVAYPIPFSGGGLTSGSFIQNRQRQPGEPEWHGEAYFVSPPFFETLRIPLQKGRVFTPSDSARAPVVCIIDRKLADRFFPNVAVWFPARRPSRVQPNSVLRYE